MGTAVLLAVLLCGNPGVVSAVTQGDINSILNGTAYYDPNATGSTSGTCSTNLVGSDNEEKIWNFLIGEPGMTKTAVAGLMGNFQTETAGTWNPRINNGGDLTDFPESNTIAYGTAQWLGGRQDKLVTEAKSQSVIAGDLPLQLNFIWEELNNSYYKPIVLDPLKVLADSAANVPKAAEIVFTNYEAPGDSSLPSRQKNAEDIYTKYSSNPPTGGSGGTTCSSSCSPNGQTSANAVVIDPGHSSGPDFSSTAEIDGAATAGYSSVNIDGTGVESIDNSGAPGERATMWQAAQLIKTTLTTAGYNVILTKKSADDNVGLLTRAKIANDAHAAIAVSLHYTGGVQFGSQSTHWGVTPQVVGESRTNESDGKTATFADASLAQTSQNYANIIQKERAAAGDPVSVANLDGSFPKSRGLPAYGNISIVQLFSKVPWVYNEDGAVGFDLQKYVAGIANGIEKSVPLSSSTNQQTSATPGSPPSTGSSAILCEAQKYTGIYYHLGGGHQGYDQFRLACPESALAAAASTSTVDDPGPCATDCSSLVSVAVDAVFNQKYNWVVDGSGKMSGTGAELWQAIPISQAQPGDIVTVAGDAHVEIVDHLQGDTIYTFGSHHTGTQTGQVNTLISYWTGGAYHWTGQGSGL